MERTLPGDRVRVEFDPEARRYRDAEPIEIVERSKDRIESVCPHFQHCGGCDWLDWKYESQLEAKDALVSHALSRQMIEPCVRHAIRGAESRLGYRTRVQMRFDGSSLGFYRRQSHDLVNIDQCAVAHPDVNEAIGKLRQNLPSERGKVEIARRDNGEVEIDWNSAHAVSGFTQVHREQNAYLRDRVRDYLATANRVLELFCGDGNLSFAYLERRSQPLVEVVAVDANVHAIERAGRRVATGEAGTAITGASFMRDIVDAQLLRRLPREFVLACDTLLLNPPRQGLGMGIERLLPKSVKRIVYVSCAPQELAKDSVALKSLGFEMRELQCIDMFPQTRHVESLALFEKGKKSEQSEKCLVN